MYALSEEDMKELIRKVKEGEDVDISRYKKRSRARSAINEKKQCRAKRADGKQCSRARREGEDYCGTHIKGCPHGRYKTKEEDKEELKLSLIEYKGIVYHIDLKKGEVYSTEDILNKSISPKIVGEYIDEKVILKKKSK
tara:strand:+ start:57 stop:473 length:417 start_codon:yes stop_codon:yes gene_type:complete